MPQQEPTILQYATAPPETAGRVSYVSEPDRLTVVIPPPRAWRLLLLPSAELVAGTVIAMGLGALAPVVLDPRNESPKAAGILVIVASGVLVFWLSRIVRLIRMVRYRRRPSVVTVDDEAITVESPTQLGDTAFAWPRDEVTELDVFARGAAPAVQTYLQLRLIRINNTVATVSVPWPRDEPMLPIETRLRLALGLPTPVTSGGTFSQPRPG
jgi:hypothetical protein